MYAMDYLIYHLRPYGIDSMAKKTQHDLNQLTLVKKNTSSDACDPEKDADCDKRKK